MSPRRPLSGLIARLPRRRSLSLELAGLFLAVVALAFGSVLVYVLPQLQSRLEEDARVELEQAAADLSAPLADAQRSQFTTGDGLNDLVQALAERADARITLLGVQLSAGARPAPSSSPFFPMSDSGVGSVGEQRYPAAERALAAGGRRTVTTGGEEPLIQTAQVLRFRGQPSWIAVYSRRVADVTQPVGAIRNQILVAAALALALASLGGLLVARALARRVRRLEVAARDVAAGRFGAPLPVDIDDELGQLTRAFNEMQDQLARLDGARREFIANASHELRTPIFSLGGFAELLDDEELDPETRAEFLAAMREQISRLTKLSIDLLDLSRLDAGALDLQREPIDLADVARSVAAEFGPAAQAHGTVLELRLDGGAAALCDRERVAQIVRILVDNALRHTPRGARVAVTVDLLDGAANLLVTDTGPSDGGRPVDPAGVEQLFERFYTADAVRGSGLGLAIARELAERMDGSLVVRPGQEETVFALSLPSAPEPAALPELRTPLTA